MLPYLGPAARMSFEESLEQELFSKFVTLHLLAALASLTGTVVSLIHHERTFLLVLTAACSLPPVVALLLPQWVRRNVIALWTLTSGGVLMIVVAAGHDVALACCALLYGALGPIPPRWRVVPIGMALLSWVVTRALGIPMESSSLFLLVWCCIFSVWLSTAAYQARRAGWLELRLSLHQDRLLTKDLDALHPSRHVPLEDPDLVEGAVRELESALTSADGELREGIERALTALRRALADTGAHVAPGFATRFRLGEVLDEAWQAAMTQTRSPIRARVEVPATLEAYGDVPRITSLLRELLMELSMSAAGEVPRSLSIEADAEHSVLTISFTASDERSLPEGIQHRLEVRAAEAGAHLELQARYAQVRLPVPV